jgi:tripeptide aminopeptidase
VHRSGKNGPEKPLWEAKLSKQASDLAARLEEDVRERFLRYVRIDTQARGGVDEVPSTPKQLDLSRLLVEELNGMGASDVEIDDHGIVFATIPATTTGDVPVIGVLAHVDTSPDASGAGVTPQVIRYEGGRVPLPGDENVVLDPDESPELKEHVGHDIVTTDGTTLLGADDKAGVAAIMSATAYLLGHDEIPHGKVRVAFTTDEEVGKGAKYFDIERFGAVCAYTIDGSRAGDIEDETFSAAEVNVRFKGFGIHPGYAKGRLVNALKLASDFIARLPQDESPEATDERDGYVHPVHVDGDVEQANVQLIIRDFDTSGVHDRIETLRGLAHEVVTGRPDASVEFEHAIQYLNMRDHLDKVPHVVDAAVEAIRRAGLEPRRGFIRGGTDGSMLTAKGLPTPNIFSGAHDFHSVKEWVCVADMAAAASTIVHLSQVWAEQGSR